MSFETGGDMQDPFQEEEEQENDAEAEVEDEADAEAETSESDVEFTEPSKNESKEEPEYREPQSESESAGEMRSRQTTESNTMIPYIKDLDVTNTQSPTYLAHALMVPDYHDENPPVPYSVWRNGTSTGRRRTTIELNSDVDELVKQAMREFNSRYDADIHKADIRELALVYGLVHLDEVFAMAEEWGIQYNS